MWLEELTIKPRKYFNPYPVIQSDCLKKFLQMCPNMKKIDIDLDQHLSMVLDDCESLKKLQVIRRFHIRRYESNNFETLVTKYRTSLKELKVYLVDPKEVQLKTCFAHISRFESLESFELIVNEFCGQPIAYYFRPLTKIFAKLKQFTLKTHTTDISNQSFLSMFRSLKRLVLDFGDTKEKLIGSVECLKHCKRLKHLSISNEVLTQDFFVNIQTFLPNIQNIDINSKDIIVEPVIQFKEFMESFQSLRSIERVVVNNLIKYYYCRNC